MFKHLTLFRTAPGWAATPADIDERLGRLRFAPCAATQPHSTGWVPPRGPDHAPLVESVGGQWLCRLMTERRLLPSAVVQQRVDALAEQAEAQSGRKPGKKQRRELKDQATLELLPQAFTKRGATMVWLDPERGLVMVDASSAARASDVATQLVKALEGLVVLPLQTAQSPAACMAAWLQDGEPPAGFTIDRDCVLKSEDAMKSVVRYARHPLDIDEIRQHIATGKRPTQLALTWNSRVSLLLTDALQLKKIELLDVVLEGQPSMSRDDDPFDADAAIATGELAQLIPDLIAALGGEPAEAAAAPLRKAA